jgi:NADPH:quinone reductase-like Zn-dependent oxidoreductase
MQVYSVGLYTSRRISIQTHYILWQHPIHRGGAKPHSPTLIDPDMQDRGYELRRISLPRTRITACLEAGALHPRIARRMPLERIADAHEVVEGGRSDGRVILDID